LQGNKFTMKNAKLAKAPGYGGYDSYGTFSAAEQKAFAEWYDKKYTEAERTAPKPTEQKFAAPDAYDDRYDHFVNFFESIRTGKKVVEDATFGLRAAGPAVLANLSYEKSKVIHWNPDTMKIVG